MLPSELFKCRGCMGQLQHPSCLCGCEWMWVDVARHLEGGPETARGLIGLESEWRLVLSQKRTSLQSQAASKETHAADAESGEDPHGERPRGRARGGTGNKEAGSREK